MPTGYKIVFSKRAEEDYDRIVQYLLENWSETVARQFVLDMDKEIARIQAFPYIFPSSFHKPGVRRCVMSKIHTVYYNVEKNKIFIITIFDNRQKSPGL